MEGGAVLTSPPCIGIRQLCSRITQSPQELQQGHISCNYSRRFLLLIRSCRFRFITKSLVTLTRSIRHIFPRGVGGTGSLDRWYYILQSVINNSTRVFYFTWLPPLRECKVSRENQFRIFVHLVLVLSSV